MSPISYTKDAVLKQLDLARERSEEIAQQRIKNARAEDIDRLKSILTKLPSLDAGIGRIVDAAGLLIAEDVIVGENPTYDDTRIDAAIELMTACRDLPEVFEYNEKKIGRDFGSPSSDELRAQRLSSEISVKRELISSAEGDSFTVGELGRLGVLKFFS